MVGVEDRLTPHPHPSHSHTPHSHIPQEIIVLTISTLWWEEEMPSIVNFVGMVVCVSGIALHILFKALRTNSKHLLSSLVIYYGNGLQ